MITRRRQIGLAVLAVAVLAASTAHGQWRGRSRRGSTDSDGTADSRLERAERLIVLFDANRDGIIEPSEVHGRSRYIFERMTKEAGLDPTHSVSVSELRAAVARRLQKAKTEAAPSSTTPASGDAKRTDGSKEAADAAPQVAGFGVERQAPEVRGFGPAGGTASSPPRSSGPSRSSSSGGSTGSSGSPGDKNLDTRIRRYAESLLKRYDANKNGVLEKDEWKKMRGSPEKGDRNKDGVITLEELTARLSEYSRKSSSSSSTTSSTSSTSTSSHRSRYSSSRDSGGSADPGDRKSYRFLSATERLPKGLPDWFARKDANGDGQVAMAEYSTDWDDAKAGEFAKYDRNNDGLITPQECLDAESSD